MGGASGSLVVVLVRVAVRVRLAGEGGALAGLGDLRVPLPGRAQHLFEVGGGLGDRVRDELEGGHQADRQVPAGLAAQDPSVVLDALVGGGDGVVIGVGGSVVGAVGAGYLNRR